MSIQDYDPSAPGNADNGIFGLPFSMDEATVAILPVPWDVTVSYGAGTVEGPEAVWQASPQLDLFDEDMGNPWEKGIAMAPLPEELKATSQAYRAKAETIIQFLESGGKLSEDSAMQALQDEVNGACADMVAHVKREAGALLDQGKRVILLGGDHSTPLGYLQALADRHEDFGILQIDAHMDLREAYEGFRYSHASIMRNAMDIPQISKLVQVGIRDFCEEEMGYLVSNGKRVTAFTSRFLKRQSMAGRSWADVVQDIVNELPLNVYISFDIDGLEPYLCPHTGTPVPAGLEFEQVMYLFEEVVKARKHIVGADLVEVAPGPDGDEWDGNVGARLLYRMCSLI